MKILHVTKKYPNALGGDAVVVSNLVKYQKTNGYQTIILTSNCNEIKNSKNIYKFGLEDTSASLDDITIKRLISLVTLFFKAFRILKHEHPDIIHTHAVDMAFCISFAARHYQIPIIHTFHIVTFYDKKQSFVRRITELFLVRKTRAAIITAPNAYDVKKLQEAGLKHVVLLPDGIDLDFWKKYSGSKKESVFTFMTVGRLEEQKGIVYLIKSAAILRDNSKKKFRVLIIGEGSLKSPLENLVKSLQLEGYIEFLGKKDPVGVRKIYNSSHVAVFPSLYETTPLTLLESWAMQLPVIATRVGILRDPGMDGLVLPIKEKDAQVLALAMQKILINNPNIVKSLVENGSKEVKRKYQWSNINKTIIEQYKNVIFYEKT